MRVSSRTSRVRGAVIIIIYFLIYIYYHREKTPFQIIRCASVQFERRHFHIVVIKATVVAADGVRPYRQNVLARDSVQLVSPAHASVLVHTCPLPVGVAAGLKLVPFDPIVMDRA